MDLGLEGKVAMVAGASRGLGYAVARALAADGARISMLARDGAVLRAAASSIAAETGGQVLAVEGDVCSAAAVEHWHATTVERYGGVDLLFTNGGGPPPGLALAFDDEEWMRAFDLLVLSVVRMVRTVVPSMMQRGSGSILMATSSAVKEPIPNLALSTVLRASVAALAKSLALELAPRRIRVNQLVPGRIDTDRVRELDEANGKKLSLSAAEQQLRSVAAIPLGRYGAPQEFGQAAAFLLSTSASYVTGATLQVDGGLIRTVL
jgi:3-oxoacyl-[acyl-carrier protein] reductase